MPRHCEWPCARTTVELYQVGLKQHYLCAEHVRKTKSVQRGRPAAERVPVRKITRTRRAK